MSGDPNELRVLLESGFGPHLGHQQGTPLETILRPARLVIIDRAGGIRGAYPATKIGLEELIHRSIHVMLEQPTHER